MPAVTRAQKITFGEMRSPDLLRGLSLQPFVRDQRHRSPRTPEERISPKVIFTGRSDISHDSADRGWSEAARGWGAGGPGYLRRARESRPRGLRPNVVHVVQSLQPLGDDVTKSL